MRRAALWLMVIGLAAASLTLDLAPADPTVTRAPPRESQLPVQVFALSDPLARGPLDDLRIHMTPQFDQPLYRAEIPTVGIPCGSWDEPAPGIMAVESSQAFLTELTGLQRTLIQVASGETEQRTTLGAGKNELRVEEALDRTLDLHFTEAPRSHVLAEFERQLGAKIVADWTTSPWAPDEPLTLHGRVRARLALRYTLARDFEEELNPVTVVCVARGGEIHAVRRDEHPRLQVYPVLGLYEGWSTGPAFVERVSQRVYLWQALLGSKSHDDIAGFLLFEPAGALVGRPSTSGDERIEQILRSLAREQSALLRGAEGPVHLVERALAQSITLDARPRSVPQFLEYLAGQTQLTVLDRRRRKVAERDRPTLAAHLVAGDGQTGTLREQLTRVLTPAGLGFVVDDEALVITSLAAAERFRPGRTYNLSDLAEQIDPPALPAPSRARGPWEFPGFNLGATSASLGSVFQEYRAGPNSSISDLPHFLLLTLCDDLRDDDLQCLPQRFHYYASEADHARLAAALDQKSPLVQTIRDCRWLGARRMSSLRQALESDDWQRAAYAVWAMRPEEARLLQPQLEALLRRGLLHQNHHYQFALQLCRWLEDQKLPPDQFAAALAEMARVTQPSRGTEFTLIKALGHPAAEVRAVAAQALATHLHSEDLVRMRLFEDVEDEAPEAATAYMERRLKLLSTAKPDERSEILRMLLRASYGRPALLDPLKPWAEEAAAASAPSRGEMHECAAWDLHLELLRDIDPDVRRATIQRMAKHYQDRAGFTAEITPMLNDPFVADAAHEALEPPAK